ncbi:isoleucine--tRNA ligase, partial [Candidatus Parcubacteria bacterium]
MSDEKKSVHALREEEILSYWDKNQCFEKSVENRPMGNSYVFYDGPPFATGLPHYGHIVGSVMKDVVPRFWTMKGRRVERIWGWDCHGLPIENIVEKEKNLGSRKDIENYGIAEFNETCRTKVLAYAAEWQKIIHRLGRWVDMDNAYKTMDFKFMESIWWVFKSLWDKGLIYEGRKPMHICPRCETVLSNFEVTQAYKDVSDISVYVKMPLLDGEYAGVNLVIWTTTPWTLPGNELIAVGKNMRYALAELNGERYILLEDKVQDLLPDAVVKTTLSGSDLIGAKYKPLFETFANTENAFRVVAADFVSDEEGTGAVHIAPGFGEDDMNVGVAEGVKPIIHVKMNGLFTDDILKELSKKGCEVQGVPVRQKDNPLAVDIEIIKLLDREGRLLTKEKVKHSYPHCWRCDTPLLNYSTSSWFVKVTEVKDRMIQTNKEINWVPDHIKEGRFGKWLEGARDWAISRSRFWGTPLPIWKSDDGDIICVGSSAELEELSGKKVDDLHKHVIDEIVIEKDGKVYKRIDEVLDCWFESGSMPYAQLHYPFENKEKFDHGFPAEFIAEGQDQTRGWFYT